MSYMSEDRLAEVMGWGSKERERHRTFQALYPSEAIALALGLLDDLVQVLRQRPDSGAFERWYSARSERERPVGDGGDAL